MPCYYTGSAEGDARLAVEESGEKVALLENMLCGLCSRSAAKTINKDPVLKKWWKAHQKRDAKEKAVIAADKKRAALAKTAIKKLTKSEKEALGIRD